MARTTESSCCTTASNGSRSDTDSASVIVLSPHGRVCARSRHFDRSRLRSTLSREDSACSSCQIILDRAAWRVTKSEREGGDARCRHRVRVGRYKGWLHWSLVVTLKLPPNGAMTAILPIRFAYPWKNALSHRITTIEATVRGVSARHQIGASWEWITVHRDTTNHRTEKCKIEHTALRHACIPHYFLCSIGNQEQD